MKTFLQTLISMTLIALLASCGTTAPTPKNPGTTNPTNPTNPTPNPNPAPPTNPTPSNLSFKTAAILPEGLKDLEQDLTPSLVGLVEIARSKSQNPNTLAGTLTQTSNGFSFSATPSDRLKLVLSDGQAFEFFISKFQGNLANGSNAFYKSNHLVEYRAKFTAQNGIGAADLQVSSQRQGSVLGVKLGGSAVFEGASNALSLAYTQQVISDFGPGSIEFHHKDSLQGSISGSVQIQVGETYDFKVVGGSSSLVLQTIRTFDNTWSEAGAQFRLQDGRIQKVFRDGKPIEADFWKAQGTLSRNGVQVGGLGQSFTGNILEFFFDTPNGRIRLEANQF